MTIQYNSRSGTEPRGNARDRFSPSPTRVRDARKVVELAAELAGHLLCNHLSKQEVEEVLAELVEVANDYGFISGEQELDAEDIT